MGPENGESATGDWRCSILALMLLQWAAAVVLEVYGRVWRGGRVLSSRNDEPAARTAEDPSRTGLPEKAAAPAADPNPDTIPDAAEPSPRTALQTEMMEDGGPYSPSLYGATAPLRQAQKKTVDDLRMQQVIAHTKILEGRLAKDKADLSRYESSQKAFKAGWEDREKRLDKDMTAAKQSLILAKEEIPLTEKVARAAKGDVLACERVQSEAMKTLADAKQSTIDAQGRLQRAASRADTAKTGERSAKAALDSVRGEEKDARSRYDSAYECWLPPHNKLDGAESRWDEAVKSMASAESRRDTALAAQERARAEQEDAKKRMDEAGDSGRKTQLARSDMGNAERAEQEAQDAEDVAEMAEAEAPEYETRQAMDNAEAVLRDVQNRASKAEAAMSKARQTWMAAQKAKAAAQKALDDARKAQAEAEAKADTAKENTENAKTRLQQAQHEMPLAEVLESARRDLDAAAKDLESAKKRYDMAGRCMTAADRKEKSAGLLRAAGEAHQKDGAERWNAEGDALTALGQIKDRGSWAQERFAAVKRMRAAGEGLRAAGEMRAESIRKDAEYCVQLARGWMSQARAALDYAKERHEVATRWLNDAEREGWPHGGARWPDTDQKTLAAEQDAVKNMRVLMDERAEGRMKWVKRMQDDAGGWDAFVKWEAAEEADAANMRMQDDQSIRDANRMFNLILESLERVPEPGRTEANIDICRNGVEAAKPHLPKQDGGASRSAKHRRFMSEHPEIERGISSGQMDGIILGALDATLANMDSERANISRDSEAGATPSMYHRTSFREGTLVLADRHLILYDDGGLKELERIPLDSIKKCDTDLFSSALNIEIADGKKKFHLPEKFAADHSKSDEYEIWKYLIESRKAGGGRMLLVQTTPPGAVVLVNGVPCGITPLALEKPVIVGHITQKGYEVRMLLEGHAPKNMMVDLKSPIVYEKMDRLEKADPTADMAVHGYRKQVPEGSATELFVTENLLNGENGTSLVLSRDSVVMLSKNRRILLSIPYGALEGVGTYSEWWQVSGLKVTYRLDGEPVAVKFAADKDARSGCGEIKNKLKEKMKEWSDREPGSMPDVTRLPRLGYTFLDARTSSRH